MRLALPARSSVQSLGFERSRFLEMRDEWESNFLKYMGPHDHSNQLWALLWLELWHQEFLE